jgi:septum formation protein
MAATDARELILASTSRYRAELLRRLGLGFRTLAPDCDESALPGEAPRALAMRLAAAKARRIADANPGATVIGSDQVAELDGIAFGKPGAHDAGVRQLRRCSGRIVDFHTAVCVIDGASRIPHSFVDLTRVHFRTLRDDEIERYLRAEQPYDCAGSFKCEGLGTALFSAIETTDPSGLVGLPLIGLCEQLRRCGFRIP